MRIENQALKLVREAAKFGPNQLFKIGENGLEPQGEEIYRAGQVDIPVHSGLCRLVFAPGGSTGKDPNCYPGISFTYISKKEWLIPNGDKTEFYGGMGVIGRDSAKKLADMLNKFLEENPPV